MQFFRFLGSAILLLAVLKGTIQPLLSSHSQ